MGKRIKDLEAELAATKAELADSQDRHRRATAHVSAHVQAERHRVAEAERVAREKRERELRRIEAEAERERRKARAERLEALRRGEVKLTNNDIVSVDYETGEVETYTVTLALDRDEGRALHEYVEQRKKPTTLTGILNEFFSGLTKSMAQPWFTHVGV